MRPFGRRPGHFGGGGYGHHYHKEEHWGGTRSPGARPRVLTASELRLVLLSLIAAEERHGYDLIRAVEQLSAGAYVPSPGVVYPALSVLEDVGHVVPAQVGSSRKVFTVTDAGRRELAERAADLEGLRQRLAGLPSLDRDQHAPIRRAMDNLKSVLRNSITRFEAGKEHEIAALIDDAAQKIERLG